MPCTQFSDSKQFTDWDVCSSYLYLLLKPRPGAVYAVEEYLDKSSHAHSSLCTDDDGTTVRAKKGLPMRNFSHITQFASKHELLSVLIDAIEMHETIVKQGKPRCEASIHNIVISNRHPLDTRAYKLEFAAMPKNKADQAKHEKALSKAGLDPKLPHKGYLVNWRHGKPVVHTDPQATLPFKSLAELIEPADKFVRQPHHDLESFFYIFLWICINYAGPRGTKRKNYDVANTVLHCWSNGKSHLWSGTVKKEAMYSPELFEQDILDLCAPYFEDLKPCLRRLRLTFFGERYQKYPSPKIVTHEEMMGLLRKALEGLPPL